MLSNSLLDDVETYVRQMFRERHQPYLVYHNIIHTAEVVNYATHLSHQSGLSDPDLSVVKLAAWFHDTGHLFGEPEGHEEKSVIQMQQYLSNKQVNHDMVQLIADCIMATKMPTNPSDMKEQVICDADTFHLGTPEFWNINCTVWMEKEALIGQKISDWKSKSIAFLEEHRYYTDYCRQTLDKGKMINLKMLNERLNDGEGPCLEP